MRAQDYFEDVRATVLDIERSHEMLERLCSQEELHAQSYNQQGVSKTDALDKINQRLEFEQRLKRRIDEATGILREATEVLYGADDHGGLAKLKGNRYADAVHMAYVQAMPWQEVADIMLCSVKWCRELSRAAFSYIDLHGFEKVRKA